MPNFNPEDVKTNAVEEGVYPFTVMNAELRESKAGNEMISLDLAFDVGNDKPLTCFEYLVFTEKALWKVKEFCDACGLKEQFASGVIEPDDCIGAEGKAKLVKGEKYMEVDLFVSDGWSESPTKKSLTPEQRQAGLAALKAKTETATATEQADESDSIPF